MVNQVEQDAATKAVHHAGPREAVGIFDTYQALEGAVDELLLAGFARCELSLLGQQTGPQADEPAAMLADDPVAQRTCRHSAPRRPVPQPGWGCW